MKVTVRSGVFETNSSSVHTIVIEKQKDVELHPELISELRADSYGQGTKVLKTPQEKIAYLWTAILVTQPRKEISDWFYYLVDTLQLDKNIPFDTLDSIEKNNRDLNRKNVSPQKWLDNYRFIGIDHDKNIVNFVKRMRNKKLLIQYVYGDSSVACSVESYIKKVSSFQNIDWDTVQDSVWWSSGESDTATSYLYIKGE